MPEPTPLHWRKSSYSAGGSNCVEVAALPDGRVAIRDSKYSGVAPLVVPRAGMAALIGAIKTERFPS